MKIFLFLCSLFAFMAFGASNANAQCDIDSMAQVKVLKDLSKNGYRLSKSYRVQRTCRGCNNFRNYTVIMTKGNTYTLTVLSSEGGSKGIIANFKELSGAVIASNYDDSTKKFYTSITFQCSRTAPYYLNFLPKDSKTSCGMAFLAFKMTR
ncbi:hypothetical protein ACE193_10660 [Bernardetia sp. OM2101]|uniref:hypothetical protein n=1 Tax=Bernardetia sp. OM2101 TaxID=3344876 RepID=UPI0035D04267